MAYAAMRTGGNSPTGYEPAYGGIPNLPQYTTDTTSTIGTDVQANLVRNLPGYMGMVGKDVGNITANLGGVLPADVIQQLQQRAAERGIMTGAPGSPNTDAAYLRALGLTSLQLQQLGHSQLTEAMQRTPVQQTQTGTATHDLGAERAIYAAAPVPGAAARQAIRDAQAGMSQGARYVGAPVYGGGGGYSGGTGGYGVAPAAQGWSQSFYPGGGRTGSGYEDTSPTDAYARWKAEAGQWALPSPVPATADPWAEAQTYSGALGGYQFLDEPLADAAVDWWDSFGE